MILFVYITQYNNIIIIRIKCFGHRLNTFGKTFSKCELWVNFMDELHTIIKTVKDSEAFLAELRHQQKIRIATLTQKTRKDVPKGPIRGSSTRWTYGPRFLQRSLEIFDDIRTISANMDTLSTLLKRDITKMNEFLVCVDKVRDKFPLLKLFSRFFNRIHFWLLITETASLPTSSWVIYAIRDVSLLIRNIVTCLKDLKNTTLDMIAEEQFSNAVKLMKNVKVVFKNIFINDARGNEGANDQFFLDNGVLLAAKALDIRTMFYGNGNDAALFDVRSLTDDLFEPVFDLYQFMETLNKTPSQQRVTVPPTSTTAPVDNNNDLSDDDVVIINGTPVSTSSVRNNVIDNNNRRNCFETERKEFILHCTNYVHGMKRNEIMNLNPLQFWNGEMKQKFPMFFAVAMMVLAVPAQSASSERVFSAMTAIISNKRQSLGVNRAADLINSSFSHSCAKLAQKQKAKRNKRQITFPLCGSYGDLKDINFELIDENDEDYTPDDDNNDDDDDDDELIDSTLEGFIVPENWAQLQQDMNDEVSDNEEDEDNRNGIDTNPYKRMRIQNTQFRDFDTSTNRNSRK